MVSIDLFFGCIFGISIGWVLWNFPEKWTIRYQIEQLEKEHRANSKNSPENEGG